MGIKISLPKPEEAREIQEVFYRTWLDTYPNEEAGITREDIEHWHKDASSEKTLAWFRGRIAHPPKDQTLLIAKSGDKVVGVCRLVHHPDKNQLQAIYVLPEYQRQGIGDLLWQEAQKYFDPQKSTIVQVATYNTKAINFYKKLGFIDNGKRWSNEKFRMKSGNIIPEMELELKS